MDQHRLWNPEFMTIDPKEQAKIQLENLKRQLKYEYGNSDYYRSLLPGLLLSRLIRTSSVSVSLWPVHVRGGE